MAKNMMARAIRGGVKVDFLLADAWFGTKDKKSTLTPPRMARAIIFLAICGLVSCCA
jgi:hypothetical protein